MRRAHALPTRSASILSSKQRPHEGAVALEGLRPDLSEEPKFFGWRYWMFSLRVVPRNPLPNLHPVAAQHRVRRRRALCLEPQWEQEDQENDGAC